MTHNYKGAGDREEIIIEAVPYDDLFVNVSATQVVLENLTFAQVCLILHNNTLQPLFRDACLLCHGTQQVFSKRLCDNGRVCFKKIRSTLQE